MGRYDEMLARFMAFAEREPRILMGVQVGSGFAVSGVVLRVLFSSVIKISFLSPSA